MGSGLDPLGLWARTADIVHVGVRVGRRVGRLIAVQLDAGLLPDTRSPRPLQLGGGFDDSPPASPESLTAKMDRLQRRSVQQTTSGSQAELFHRILDQIVPDEARIISALSDGSVSALVSVRGWGPSGRLDNASLVGRTANLALPLMTPTYVGHLLALGLLQVGPEEPGLRDDYQILLAEGPVRRALKAGGRGLLPARVEKGTLRLSGLGLALWEATTGEAP
jgi:hypothetical protein